MLKPAAFQIDAAGHVYERDSSRASDGRGRWKRPGTLRERIKWRSRKNLKTGCLEWTGGKSPKGYALLWWGDRTHRVTHLVWTLAGKKLPHGMRLLHRCDNPGCIRLGHLFAGTDADNMRDRDRKGRQARGTGIHCARLTAAKVLTLRRSRTPIKILAKRFKISLASAYKARNGATWKHL